MCARSHRYTVEDEAQKQVLYAGTSRDAAISALAAARIGGGCGHVTADHIDGGTATYCSEEPCLTEDAAIKVWDELDRTQQSAAAGANVITGRVLTAAEIDEMRIRAVWRDLFGAKDA